MSKANEPRRRVGAPPGGDKPPWRAALLALGVAALMLAWPTRYPPRDLVYPIARPEAARLSRAFLTEMGVDATGWHAVTWPGAGFPRLIEDDEHPELNLPPGRDDGLAPRYVVEVAGLSAWRRLAGGALPAATWITRLIPRQGGPDWFVSVDPRTRQVVGFWRNDRQSLEASKTPPGVKAAPPPEGAAAALIARLGLPGTWRRVEDSPVPAGGTRAHSTRLLFADSAAAVGGGVPVLTLLFDATGAPGGAGVALRLPPDYVRGRSQATLLSTLLVALRLGLLATLGGLGLREVARRLRGRGAEVRAIGRLLLGLLVPIGLFHLNRLPTLLVRYPAQIPWSAFLAGSAVGLMLSTLLQALLFGVALAALAAARPDWRASLPPRTWRASAPAALATALFALAVGVVVDRLELLGRIAWPGLFPGPTPAVLPGYGAIYPFFDVVWTAFTGSILIGGLIALLLLLTRGPFRSRRARGAALVLVAVGLGPDRALNAAEAIVPTLYEVLALLTAILLAQRLARGTLGAYVAVLPLALGGQTALWLAQQPEVHIRLGGVVAFLLLGAPLLWLGAQALAPGAGAAPAPPPDA